MSWLSFLGNGFKLFRHIHSTREEILLYQSRQLRRLIKHAYKNVPYYRRLFEQNGINPLDIQTKDDLSVVPITSKKDLQMVNPRDLIAQGVNPENLVVRKTTGSTGEPLMIWRSRIEELTLGAFRKRAMHYYGLGIKDKQADIEEVDVLNTENNQFIRQVLNELGVYQKNRIHGMLPIDEIINKLRMFRPEVIAGYAGVLVRIAEKLNNKHRQTIHPRFIVTHSEVLTPLMRKQIEEAFNARVFNIYDSVESNLIAWECKDFGDLHTCDDTTIMEIMRNDAPAKPGERGEVVTTNLHSFCMPIIRYRLGDIVTKGNDSCDCGQPFSTIRAVQGRMFDYLILPGGRLIHPYDIIALLGDKLSWIRQYRIVQELEDEVFLQVVPSALPSGLQLTTIKESISKLLGSNVNFKLNLVREFPNEGSAKFRVCRSLLKSDYDSVDWNHC